MIHRHISSRLRELAEHACDPAVLEKLIADYGHDRVLEVLDLMDRAARAMGRSERGSLEYKMAQNDLDKAINDWATMKRGDELPGS